MAELKNIPESPRPKPKEDWTDPVTGMELIWIETLQLWVGKYQVTNGEYRRFKPKHNSGEYEGQDLNGDRQPACGLSFEDGMNFCNWLRKEYDKLNIDQCFILRLPNHREWTLFASCGKVKTYPWGSEWPPTYGNYGDEAAKKVFPEWDVIEGYDDGHAVSCPVEESGCNEWGLYGVGGNVYEWTFEADGTATELRGASWSTYQKEYLTLDNRYRREPKSSLVNFGIRILMLE